MYVRIVRGQTRPGQVEELARRWEAFVGPRLREAPGFQRAYFAGDRAASTTVGVTVWDAPPDRARMEQTMQAFREQIGELIAGSPTIEEFEVLVEL